MRSITTTIKSVLPLFKIRICTLIALSAVVGLFSASNLTISAQNVIYLAVATMMSAAGASAFNHYYDLDIDSVMKRTKNRPIPTGVIANPRFVLAAAAALFIASLLLSIKVLNFMVGLHLFLGAFTYAVLYTVWLKRRSSINIIIGGLAGSFAVLAGGASVAPQWCLPPIFLAITMFFWTPSHFWSFAIANREDYETAKVPMLPTKIGDKNTAWLILANTILLVGSTLLPLYYGFFGPIYAAAAVVAGAYFIVKNVMLIRNNTRVLARENFLASMAYLGIVFAAVIIDVVIY